MGIQRIPDIEICGLCGWEHTIDITRIIMM